MEAQLQKSINIKSLPNNPEIYNQTNNELLEELNIDQNLTNEILNDIKKQEKSLQQDIAYNRMLEDRKLDVAQPTNPFVTPKTDENDINKLMEQQNQHSVPQNSSNIPANILTQQPHLQEKPVVNNSPYVSENFVDNKNNFNHDLIEEETSDSYITSVLNYVKKIYKELLFTIIFFYLYQKIEVDLIATASLSSLIKVNLLSYQSYIGAIMFAVLYLIVKKYVI